jgi:hypothetical protein
MGTVVSDSQTMLLLVGPKDASNTSSQSVGLAIDHVGEVLKIPVFKFEFDFLRLHELEGMIANIATKGKVCQQAFKRDPLSACKRDPCLRLERSARRAMRVVVWRSAAHRWRAPWICFFF